jgi:hypothetical protein
VNGPGGKLRVTIDRALIPTGQFHHLAAILAIGGTGSIQVYVDGAPVSATIRDGSAPGGSAFASSTMYLASRGGASLFAPIIVDELAIFKRALTADEIATLALVPAHVAGTLYVDAGSGAASDAHTYDQARDPATPLVTINRAVVLAQTGDTIRVTKATKYAAFTATTDTTSAHGVTVIGAAGGTNRPVIDSMTLGDLVGWTFEDLILSGTPGASSFVYRGTNLTWRRCDFQQGGGQLLHWTGLYLFENCDIAAPWDQAHSTDFMTGVGFRISAQYTVDAFHADDVTFSGCHFHDVGGEDAIQLLLGGGSHAGTVTVDRCHFERVQQGTGSGAHTDCIQSAGCHNLTVTACRFEESESMIIASDDFIDALVVENCLFIGSAISGYSTQFSGVRTATIANNTWARSRFGGLRFYVNGNPVGSRVRAIFNNVIDLYSIDDGWAPLTSEQHHNIIGAGPVTASDRQAFAEFGTSADTDYELATQPTPSPGVDQGTSTGAPTLDRLGRAREGLTDCGCHESHAAQPVSVDVAGRANVSAALFPVPGQTINPATVTASTFYVTDPTGQHLPVVSVTVDGEDVLTLNIDGELYPLVVYTATLTTGIADTQGSALAAPVSWTFRVAGPGGPAVYGPSEAGIRSWVSEHVA